MDIGVYKKTLAPINEGKKLNTLVDNSDQGGIEMNFKSLDVNDNEKPQEPKQTKTPGENKEVNSAMRFIVRRYDSVPTVDQSGSAQDLQSYTDIRAPRHHDNSPSNAKNAPDTATIDTATTTVHSPELLVNGGVVSADDNGNKLDTASRRTGLSLETLTDASVMEAEIDNVVHRGRVYAKRHRRRLVHKNGDVNIVKSKISNARRKFCQDIFTTVLEIKWRFIMLIFALGFVLSWLLFAVIWYLIMRLHEDHKHINDENWTMCIENVFDFPTALLFSIETQHTIGYGARMVNSKCLENIPLLMLQSCLGVFIQALLAGLIFAKLSRPKKRSNTIMFSKNAVICKRDGEVCLLFRVGDMRKQHIVGCTIRAVMVKNRLTAEGELIPLCSVPMKVEAETMIPDDNFVFLAWPVTVVHRINKDSPLWDVGAEQLLQEKFEIVVVLEGTIESTGMTAQLRTSYLPSEILWGHHLSPLVTYQKTGGQYKVAHTEFHASVPIKMPDCSAKELHNKAKADRNNCNSNEGEEEEREYPVNFTAPTSAQRQKRAWSLRRGSLRGSLRHHKPKNKSKGATVAASTPQNGNAKFIATPSMSSMFNGTQSTCTSLQSVTEARDDLPAAEKKPQPSKPHLDSTGSDAQERTMRRSSSSPEHCIQMEARDVRSAEASDTELL